ncbi:MAG TPA: glycosyltransferase family 2 protein [Acetobacteraceae bacterium]|nr:glycosyltransferase family 2 protein [Acetobacteraceae bacterium]
MLSVGYFHRPPRVAAVVVTYNRAAMLLDCLQQLQAQTAPVATLIIVDNASTDGTDARLRASGILAAPHVRYLRMPENTGGAGGFHAGMRAALEAGADWIWCMDDDVAPAPDCLERLLGFAPISECIHPLVLYEDGLPFEWEHIFDPATTMQIPLGNVSFRNGKNWCAMRVACFEGMLVSRRVLEAAGLPEPDFFISSDDALFGLLASEHTTVIYVAAARMTKKIKPTRAASPPRIYYDLRNRFLLRRRFARRLRLPRYSGLDFACFMLCYTVALLRGSPSLRSLSAAARAWADGLRGRAGRRYP